MWNVVDAAVKPSYIYVSILCTHLSNCYQLNDVYMVPVIFAQFGEREIDVLVDCVSGRREKNKKQKQKGERNTKEKEK